LNMCPGSLELRVIVYLSGIRNQVLVSLLNEIGRDQLPEDIVIFRERPRETGSIKLDRLIHPPDPQVSVRQHDPVVKGIGKAQVIFQPPDPPRRIQHGPQSRLNIAHVPDVHDLRKKVDDTADQGEENNDKNPPLLVVVPNAVDHAYDLQYNRYYIKIAGKKSQYLEHATNIRKMG